MVQSMFDSFLVMEFVYPFQATFEKPYDVILLKSAENVYEELPVFCVSLLLIKIIKAVIPL